MREEANYISLLRRNKILSENLEYNFTQILKPYILFSI